jgi:hypothetical protein
MTNVSRRNVLIGAAVASAGTGASPGRPILPDDLAGRAAEWIAADERLAAMYLRWQRFETLLFDRARRMKMPCEEACDSDLPEAQAMRALDTEIEETRRWLDASAGEIRLTPAATVAGAIAKIELGLKVQGPFDWQEHALELLEDGIAELRELLRKALGAGQSSVL